MRARGSSAYNWGATPGELTMGFPCDRFLSDADGEYFRAVSVAAPADALFRWLCQLKVAPYSYDLLDNLGRRSPRELTPGVERLARGQKVMTIFELADFRYNEHLTLTLGGSWAGALFGRAALSYVVLPVSEGHCRLVAKLRVRYPERPPGSWMRWLLPWGDLLMMRKQLLTLKRLAEGQRPGTV